jgi:hypothetical protein
LQSLFSRGGIRLQRIILIYGAIAGLVIIATNTLNLEFGNASAWLGFLVMFIAFSVIYVAVRQHRDEALGGVIAFKPALLVGLGISAVAGVVYVGLWELYLASTGYAFIDDYSAAMLQSGPGAMSEAELTAAKGAAEQFGVQYRNPAYRLPMSFLEIFPVGLLISLICAAVLRNQRS